MDVQAAVRHLLGLKEPALTATISVEGPPGEESGVPRRFVRVLVAEEKLEGPLVLRITKTGARDARCWVTGPLLSLSYDLGADRRNPFDDAAARALLLGVRAAFERLADSPEAHVVGRALEESAREAAARPAPACAPPVRGARWSNALGFHHECELSGAEEDILYMAVELGVPQLLARAGPSRAEDIVAGVGGDAEMFGPFLRVLVDMGLLVRTAGDERCALDPGFAPLDVVLAALDARREIRDTLRELMAVALRKGRIDKWMHAEDVQRSLWSAGIRLMSIKHQRSFPELLRLAEELGLERARRLLDVGAGSGHHAAAFLTTNLALHVVAADYPHVMPEVRATLERFSLLHRATLLDAPFLSPDWLPPGGCDAVWYANTMHVAGLDENRSLVRKLHDSLEPGGRLVIQERVRKPGTLVNSMNELAWTLGSTGRAYDVDEVTSVVAESGFASVEVRDLDDTLVVVGTKS
jgi:SAM-dependent methyltransferase